MKKYIEIKCRHGVTYTIESSCSEESIFRLQKMLEDCCCYVCRNLNCPYAIDGKQQCNEECVMYTKTPFCEKK